MSKMTERARTYRLPNPTTPEDLECRWSKTLRFGDKVILAGHYYNGTGKASHPTTARFTSSSPNTPAAKLRSDFAR